MYKSFSANQYKEHLGLPVDYKVDGVVCYGTPYDTKALKSFEECLEQLGVENNLSELEHPFLKFIREIKIGDKNIWFMSAYGGAMLSEYMHWACIFGSKKNILVGSCGGLKPGMKKVDMVVPESSYARESSTQMYERDTFIHRSNPSLSLSLKKRLEVDKETIWQGPMVTCQGMLGETMDDVQKWSNDGYYAVEMEASTFFAVSNHFNVPSAACLQVSDNLIDNHTVMDENYSTAEEANIRSNKKYVQIKASIQEILA